MVDRIEKTKPSDYWKIQESQKSKEEKRDQSSEGEKEREKQSFFEEKIDLEHLLPKTPTKIGTVFEDKSRLKASIATSLKTSTEREVETHSPSSTESEITLIKRFPEKFRDKLKSFLKIQTLLYLAIIFLFLISIYFVFRILMK